MKNKFKKCLTFCLLFCLLLGFFPSFKLFNLKTNASVSQSQNLVYYEKLTTNQKKFYNALLSMKTDGTFKTGNGKYNLITSNVVSESQIKEFQNGDSTLLKDFGAARDVFMLENPDVFYVDFDKLSVSLSMKGSEFIANIDAGRNDIYYTTGFSSKANVETAITAYSTAISTAKASLDAITDTKQKIVTANEIVCEKTKYSFDADGTDAGKAQIRTAYGALVNGYAVCEGYARAFKALMDTQNIPCTEVVGNVYSESGSLEPHAWNYVKLSEKWYLVDTTFNASDSNHTKYLLLGSENAKEYVSSKYVSNSGYEMVYPNLATYNYGTEEIKTNVSYDKTSEPYSQTITFEYNGKTSATAMKEDGLYLVMRHEYFNKNNEYAGWANAFAVYLYEDDSHQISINQNTFSTQFFVTTEVPDESNFGIVSLDESKILAKSDVIYNEIYNESAQTPKVQSITPSATSVLDAETTYEVSITYNMNLKLTDSNSPIEIFVYSEKSSNLNSYVTVKDVKLENEDTISFTFTPSKMYEHDNLTYRFMPRNVVSKNGDLVPASASLRFARPWKVCSKIYDDGRLYINAYGSPTIIDSSDLSMTGFLDKDGKQVAENQRSQLVLVASKPNETLTAQMKENVDSLLGSNENLSSATYEIDLHICGGLTQIPSGSYMKVAFGFPEGYGPKDKGTTFKVYHFKKDASGNIDTLATEEIPCVVTEYGIVAVVKSFSPFMIVATNKTETTKNIYSKVISGKGTISAEIESGETRKTADAVATLSSGDKIVFTISAETGYKAEYAILGKKQVPIVDGKITLSYDELESNNELSVSFASQSVLETESENNIVSLNKIFLENENKTTTAKSDSNDSHEPSTDTKTTLIIVCSCVTVLLVVATIVLSLKKKKA